MQSNVVMAFRKRLKWLGYYDVIIRQYKDHGCIRAGWYTIQAREPLAGRPITVSMPLAAMYRWRRGCTYQHVHPDLQQVDLVEVEPF